ncbi:MAG: CPBP family intramembrane glutamic endopeptidase [Armatimonadota bacterium]
MYNLDFTGKRYIRLLRIAAVVAVFVAAFVIQYHLLTNGPSMQRTPEMWRANAAQQVMGADISMRFSFFAHHLAQSRNLEFADPLKPDHLYDTALASYERIVLDPGQHNPYALHRAGVMYGLAGYPDHARDMLIQAAQINARDEAMYLALLRLFTAEKGSSDDLGGVLPQLRKQPKWLQDLTIPYYYRTIDDSTMIARSEGAAREHQIAFGLWGMMLLSVIAAVAVIGIGVIVAFLWRGIVGERETPQRKPGTLPILVPWSVLDALEALAVLTVLVIGTSFGAGVLQEALGRYTDNPAVGAGIVAVQYIASVGLALAFALSKTRATHKLSAMGLRTSGRAAKLILTGLFAYSVLVVAAVVASLSMPQLTGAPIAQVGMKLMGQHTALSVVIYLILLAVVAPIAEELLFRGYLYPALRENMSKFAAVAISAMLFGLLHMNPVAIVPIVIIGIVLAILYETTHSVVPGVVCHALNNTIVFCILMLAQF